MKNKSTSAIVTVLAFLIAIVIFTFMEKNTFTLIVGGTAVVLGLINVIQLIRRR